MSAWSMLVVILGGLAAAERTYSSLMFLTQNLSAKFFGRKDVSLLSSFVTEIAVRRVD